MIFVGGGALLDRAVQFALENEVRVDAVFVPDLEANNSLKKRGLNVFQTQNINSECERLRACSSDGLVVSINNGQLFERTLLGCPELRFFNIHNGLIPKYRGRPEVCVIFALLHEEADWGATLHEVDTGIDTGATLDVSRFAIDTRDDFQRVMRNAITHCDLVFRRNLRSLVTDCMAPQSRPETPSHLYKLSDISRLREYRGSSRLAQATRFGVFRLHFRRAWSLVERQLQALEAGA